MMFHLYPPNRLPLNPHVQRAPPAAKHRKHSPIQHEQTGSVSVHEITVLNISLDWSEGLWLQDFRFMDIHNQMLL